MTESQAWRIVAEEYDTGRTWSRFLCVNLEMAVRNAEIETIPLRLRQRMVDRIHAALPEQMSVAYNAQVPISEGRDGRILACLLFSEMSK